jgi:hypothetical protein
MIERKKGARYVQPGRCRNVLVRVQKMWTAFTIGRSGTVLVRSLAGARTTIGSRLGGLQIKATYEHHGNRQILMLMHW